MMMSLELEMGNLEVTWRMTSLKLEMRNSKGIWGGGNPEAGNGEFEGDNEEDA
jgi:hypothetical protein